MSFPGAKLDADLKNECLFVLFSSPKTLIHTVSIFTAHFFRVHIYIRVITKKKFEATHMTSQGVIDGDTELSRCNAQ